MTSKVIIFCGLVALVNAGALRPEDHNQWKPTQDWGMRSSSWSQAADQEPEKMEESTTVKSSSTQRFATRTYFGYGDSKPIHEESVMVPQQMRHTEIYASKPTVEWYHRQPTFSWEYKRAEPENVEGVEAHQTEEKEEMRIAEMKVEFESKIAAAETKHEADNRQQPRYQHNYRQEQEQQMLAHTKASTESFTIQNTKESDAEEEIRQNVIQKVETISETKPIVVLESAKPLQKMSWKNVEKWAPVNYEFHYEVNDEETGDIKHHQEKAVEGKISGEYGLLDADGMMRIVQYTADDVNGFLANVRREETSQKAANKPRW